jgi:hypothetical protein
MSPFKVNYSYELRTLITLKQVKKRSEIAKKRLKVLINLYIDLYKLAKIV